MRIRTSQGAHVGPGVTPRLVSPRKLEPKPQGMNLLRNPSLLAASALLFAACGSTDLSKATKPFREGKIQQAADEIAGISGDNSTDGVWIQMEKGSILKAAGRFGESQQALDQCQQRMDELLAKSDAESVAVGGIAGAGAVMTDDRQCTYVGALYESQMVCALQAMNSLLMSNLSNAQAAISSLRARVDEADEAKEKARQYLDKKREENMKEGEGKSKGYEAQLALTTADDKLKAAYTSWADSALGIGLYLGAIVDRESGKGAEFQGLIQRSAESARSLSHLADDAFYPNLAKSLDAAVGELAALPNGPTTYVIVESGLAPFREVDGVELQKMQEKGLDVQLPVLRHEPARLISGWMVESAPGQAKQLSLLTSISVVKQNEFDINYPDIRYRAVLGKIIKKSMQVAGATVAIAAKDNEAKLMGAAVWAFGAVSDALQGADLRSWDCLPSAYYAISVPTPASGALKVSAEGGASAEVKVVPGVSNFVVVTSLSPAQCVAHSAPIQPVAAPSN